MIAGSANTIEEVDSDDETIIASDSEESTDGSEDQSAKRKRTNSVDNAQVQKKSKTDEDVSTVPGNGEIWEYFLKNSQSCLNIKQYF